MTTLVLRRAFADRRRSLIGYGIGLGLMIVWVMAIYPSIASALADYMEAMPEVMKQMFGVEDITNLAGFVNAEIFSAVGPIVLIAVGITFGAGTLAGEEHDRTLQLVLAMPVRRSRVVLAKLWAMLLNLTALGLLTALSLLVGVTVAGGGIPTGNVLAASAQLTALGWLFGALALAVGAVTGRKGWASAGPAGLALVTYLLYVMAPMTDVLEPFRGVSPFEWYVGNNPLENGLDVGGLALLVGFSAVFAAIAVVGFERRDVGV
jgi:ABC-2 type transport system permease protein